MKRRFWFLIMIAVVSFAICIVLIFRGYIELGVRMIFFSPSSNIERYFGIMKLDDTEIIQCKFDTTHDENVLFYAELCMSEERFERVFERYHNHRNYNIEEVSTFTPTGIDLDTTLEFYIWQPQKVHLAYSFTQRNIYFLVSNIEEGKRTVLLSTNMLGWLSSKQK